MQPENTGNYWQAPDEAPLPEANTPPSDPEPSDTPELSWQASEYIHHEKETRWFLTLFGGGLVLLAVSIFLLRSLTFSILVVVMTGVLAVYARRPPRIMEYQLSTRGIHINDKTFAYTDFRYFGIIEDGPLYSAVLIPNKRFMPAVNVYFPQEHGEEIVDMLGEHLPLEKVELDIVDKVTRKLRF